ncbi:hypothetical protein [Enterovibrio calviensis]|uniref:hypothetical protein n=1 Tax=Enterovibrio calviensis TaxID=91359 RepID=UPI0012DCADBE|nr:hypothetical protein [Enterovibrio calviensis]
MKTAIVTAIDTVKNSLALKATLVLALPLLASALMGFVLAAPSASSTDENRDHWLAQVTPLPPRTAAVPAELIAGIYPVTKTAQVVVEESEANDSATEGNEQAIDPQDPNTWRLAGVIYQSGKWNALLVTAYDNVEKVANGDNLANGTHIVSIDKSRVSWARGEKEQGTLWLYGEPATVGDAHETTQEIIKP